MTPQLILRLGRASNLPTLWTNTMVASAMCQGSVWQILGLMVAGSLLYLAGCTWNDAKDAVWDAQHRADRPIPTNLVTAKSVWLLGAFEVAIALSILPFFGIYAFLSGIITLCAIALYTCIHKRTAWAVLAMAWCRVQWVITVVVALGGIASNASLYLLALAACILLISLCARLEGQKLATQQTSKSVVISLVGALGIVIFASRGASMMALCLWLGWMAYTYSKMRTALGQGQRSGIGVFVSRALAGICLLDAVFIASLSPSLLAGCVVCFLLALLLQRWIPAT